MEALLLIFNTVNYLIEEISEEMEQLADRAKTAPRHEWHQIQNDMVKLGNEHDALIPTWKDLRNLIYLEELNK